MEPGPVEYMIVGFPGNRFTGEIAPALADLVSAGTIRIIDLAFISKNEDGAVEGFEVTDLAPEMQEALKSVGAAPGNLLSEADVLDVGEALEPNSSAALLVWEDVWAARLAQALRDAGGVLIDLQRVPHEVVMAAREFAASAA
jgi:hypothetical protein